MYMFNEFGQGMCRRINIHAYMYTSISYGVHDLGAMKGDLLVRRDQVKVSVATHRHY